MADKCVLILGSLARDNVNDISHLDCVYKRKALTSSDKNLMTIKAYLEAGAVDGLPILCVVVLLNDSVLVQASSHPTKQATLRELFGLVKNHVHLLLTYEDNLSGDIRSFTWFGAEPNGSVPSESDPAVQEALMHRNYRWLAMQAQCSKWGIEWKPEDLRLAAHSFLQHLITDGFRVVPYSGKRDLQYALERIIRESLEGTFLEVFVARDRVLAEEFDKFVSLFRKYLLRVRGIDITIVRDDAPQSIMYRFKSKELSKDDLVEAMDNFREFLTLVDIGPGAVLARIEGSGLPEQDVKRLVQEFQKDWHRLKVDIEFTVRRRMLEIEEQYVNEAMEMQTRRQPVLPPSFWSGTDSLSLLPGVAVFARNVQVQVGGHSTNVLSEEVTGSLIGLTAQDQEVLKLLDRFASSSEKATLQNSLEMLNSKDLSTEGKVTAKNRLKEFLAKHLPQVGEIAVKGLLSYLDSKISG